MTGGVLNNTSIMCKYIYALNAAKPGWKATQFSPSPLNSSLLHECILGLGDRLAEGVAMLTLRFIYIYRNIKPSMTRFFKLLFKTYICLRLYRARHYTLCTARCNDACVLEDLSKFTFTTTTRHAGSLHWAPFNFQCKKFRVAQLMFYRFSLKIFVTCCRIRKKTKFF